MMLADAMSPDSQRYDPGQRAWRDYTLPDHAPPQPLEQAIVEKMRFVANHRFATVLATTVSIRTAIEWSAVAGRHSLSPLRRSSEGHRCATAWLTSTAVSVFVRIPVTRLRRNVTL